MTNQQQLDALTIARDAAAEGEKQLKASLKTVQQVIQMTSPQRRSQDPYSFTMMGVPQQQASGPTNTSVLMTYTNELGGQQQANEWDDQGGYSSAYNPNARYGDQPGYPTAMMGNDTSYRPRAMQAVPVFFTEAIATLAMQPNVSIMGNPNCPVFLSTAEEAMRRASGLNAPMECWGCTGVDR
jgi:hypothetical protein